MNIRKIGIAVAVYEPNRQFLSSQLLSIQQQTFSSWICTVVFDSPMSDVLADPLIRPFTEDDRFKWFENPKRLGHRANFERAIGLASEDLQISAIACADQDDLWYPNKLETCAKALEAAGPLSLVHSDMHVSTECQSPDRTAWKVERRGVQNAQLPHLIVRNIVAGAAMLFDARLARLFPLIPDGVTYHDHWYALVASTLGGVHAVHVPLYSYRQHESNLIGITPFRGTFKLNPGLKPSGVPEKCRANWWKSKQLTHALREQGLLVPPWVYFTFARRVDFGLSLLLFGTLHWSKDRPLARACFARSFGKLLAALDPVFRFQPSVARWIAAIVAFCLAVPAEARSWLQRS